MKIYQWTVFNTDSYDFEHFTSTSRLEVNKAAWKEYSRIVELLQSNGSLDYASAEDIVEFCTNDRQYIATDCCGSTEFHFFEFQITA